jgi:hypothetical protein
MTGRPTVNEKFGGAPARRPAWCGFVAILWMLMILGGQGVAVAAGVPSDTGQGSQTVTSSRASQIQTSVAGWNEERIANIENTLESIKIAGEKTEGRSRTTKMIGGELTKYVKLMLGILVVIALGFPLSLWLVSRNRPAGLSDLSEEVIATLLMVEDRQGTLINVLKELQSEIDYVHGMAVTDLKRLVQQAEILLMQNEADLERTGVRKAPVKQT